MYVLMYQILLRYISEKTWMQINAYIYDSRNISRVKTLWTTYSATYPVDTANIAYKRSHIVWMP